MPAYLKILLLLVLVCIGFLIRIGFQSSKVESISEGVIGVYNETTLPQSVTNLLSQPLIRVDQSGLPQPQLVKSWTVNNDATVYTLTLKDNLYWNDGTKLKASDLAINLVDVTINILDEKNIEFKLNEAFSPFPSLLIDPIFKKNSLVGVGDYRVSSIDKNQQLITKLQLKPLSDPTLPNVIVRFYPDEKTLKTAFEIGEIQSMLGVNSISDQNTQNLISVKKIRTLNKVVAIFYNTKDKLLGDRNLRLALSYGTPEVSGEEEAVGPLPSSSWAYNPNIKDIDYNESLVKSYLGKTKIDKDAPIQLTTTPHLSSVAEAVAASWKKSGIPVVVRIESGVPQSFQALLTAQPIPQDPDQYGLWHSTQTKTNISQYKFEKVDLDLEEARKGVSKDVRREYYYDFQRVLVEQSPATFLYFPKLNVVYRNKVARQAEKVLPLQYPGQ